MMGGQGVSVLRCWILNSTMAQVNLKDDCCELDRLTRMMALCELEIWVG